MTASTLQYLAYMKDWTAQMAQVFNKDTKDIEAVLSVKIEKLLSDLGTMGMIVGAGEGELSIEEFVESVESEAIAEFRYEASITKAQFSIFLTGTYAKVKARNSGKHSINATGWVICAEDPSKKVRKARITAFEQNVHKVESLTSFGTYVATLQYKKDELESTDKELNLTVINDADFVEAPFEGIPEGDFSKKKAIVLKTYPVIPLNEALANRSRLQPDTKFVDITDVKCIKVRVNEVSVTTNKDGSEFARYSVTDSTFVAKTHYANFTVMTTSKLIEESKCGEGSQVYIFGTIEVDSRNNEPLMRACALIPIIPKPLGEEYKSLIQKPATQSSSSGLALD